MIGTGYVGLVSGVCFADFGHKVSCVDKDSSKIDALNAGRNPIWEPGLEALVTANIDRGRLTFTTDLKKGIDGAETVFIAVGTPARRRSRVGPGAQRPGGGGHQIDGAGRHGRQDCANPRREGAPAGTAVASNPEFLREGAAIADFKHPDRIVIGADDEQAREVLREIYRPLFLNKAPILFTDRRTAELTRYAANAFLALKISFINEIANLCEAVDADVQEIARGIGLDKRINAKFLHPGPGYGGSCFPKDTLALLQTAETAGVEQRIIRTVVSVNDDRKKSMAARVADALGGNVAGKRVGVLGLAFKPNTDDMRDSPSVPIVKTLIDQGAQVVGFDPAAMEHAQPLLPGLECAHDAYEVADEADALVIVTEWDEFRKLDLEKLAGRMRGRVLVDLRNVYDPAEVERAGLEYRGIGRAARRKTPVRQAAE